MAGPSIGLPPRVDADIRLTVDGEERAVTVDTRTTLLDALRERLGVTSPKKGCDHGQCGSCTVLLDGRRWLTCLSLAVAHDGAVIRTADGVAALEPDGADRHRVADAFLAHDAYQCGYCTPGQICSAIGVLAEADDGWPSAVTTDLDAERVTLDRSEIAERMSGNLCRCGAYANIVDAVASVAPTSGGPR
jgi:xanthine dehydrogenase YagT iron-sulfur-binding subunit